MIYLILWELGEIPSLPLLPFVAIKLLQNGERKLLLNGKNPSIIDNWYIIPFNLSPKERSNLANKKRKKIWEDGTKKGGHMPGIIYFKYKI